MTGEREEPPRYNRYRARRRILPGAEEQLPAAGAARRAPGATPPGPREPRPASPPAPREAPPRRSLPRRRGVRVPGSGWRRLVTPKRLILSLIALLFAWLALSLVVFLVSSHFERIAPPGDLAGVLDSAGYPLTSANNILVLGSDRRQKNSKEPGAETTGPGRSDSIMLIRTGGGHAARLSIPRDTIVEIPGHGLQKINAAHAFGGPAESVRVIKRFLGIPINHVVEVNFENFPQLIDSMGGVDYTGGCIISRLDGGFSQGGYTLRLQAGTHHINGKQALALARTRENLCAPNQNDLQREEHQQALFNSMKSRLLSPWSFLRLPWIAWNAPPAIISDMSGETLIGMFAGLAVGGTPPTRVFKHPRATFISGVGDGLTVSEGERRAAIAEFLAG